MTRLTPLVLAVMILAAPARSFAQATDGEVSEDLFLSFITPIEAALAAADAPGLVMTAPPANNKTLVALFRPIQERIGNFLHDRGYEVHTVARGGRVPEGVPVFEFEVDAAGIDYPSKRAGLLGVGSERWLRRAAFGLQGRIEDPRDGAWLWRGAPRYVVQDWVAAGDVDELAADRPAWMAEKALVPPPRSPWWERTMMAGLLAGVVILYVDGTK